MLKQALILALMLLSLVAFEAMASEVPLDFPSIQAAIDASSDGDTVMVAPGEYHEHINFNGHSIVLGSQYLISGDTSAISQTIINGDSLGTVVTFENGETENAILTGFTITRGAESEGAGIKCTNGSSPQIISNIISNNFAQVNGGGIYCVANSNPNIQQNNLRGNIAAGIEWALGGGAIYCQNSSPNISNNEINGNFAGSGAGILCDVSNSEISNNHIYENTLLHGYSINQGAGINCINHSEPTIRSNIIESNVAPGFGFGGGISYNLSGGIAEENTIKSNSADMGGGIRIMEQGYPIISNNLIFNNTASGGAGFYCDLSTPTIIKNRIISNSAGGFAGICLEHGGGLVANNIIAYNRSTETGWNAGLYFWGHINVAIVNNIIYGNTGADFGGLRGACYQDSSFVINNIIWGNSPDQFSIIVPSLMEVKYNDIQGGFSGEGNVDLDPMFRDTTNGDFHLMSTACGDGSDSPVIDMGDPRISDDLLDCIHGLGTILCDMGAYGGGFNYVAGDANGNGVANGIDVTFMINYLKFGTPSPRSYYCPHTGYVYAGADANGNCAFNGIDVTFMVNYLKGGPDGLASCLDCPAGGLSR